MTYNDHPTADGHTITPDSSRHRECPGCYSKGYAAACQNILDLLDNSETDTAARIHCKQQMWAVGRYA